MIKLKALLFFYFYILLCLPPAVYASGKGKFMVQDARAELKNLLTAGAQIEYPEKIHEKDDSHFVLFTLASLYLELGRPGVAEPVLLEDLGNKQDLYEMYESYTLLMGIYIDLKRKIPEKEINKYVRLFQRMKKSPYREMKGRTGNDRDQN